MATMTKSKPSSSRSSSSAKPSIRLLGDKVLVNREAAEERTESGIYLPEKAKDTPKTGTVLAVGDGALNTDTGDRIPLTVKKGDKVIFSSYSGTEIKLGTNEFLMMSENEILAIID